MICGTGGICTSLERSIVYRDSVCWTDCPRHKPGGGTVCSVWVQGDDIWLGLTSKISKGIGYRREASGRME